MSFEIKEKLDQLKKAKFAASAIEKELGFSNGLLGKAAKGVLKLSGDKLLAFNAFFAKAIGKQTIETLKESIKDIKPAADPIRQYPLEPKDMVFEKTTPKSYVGEKMKIGLSDEPAQWPSEQSIANTISKAVIEYCELEAITPLELIEQHKSFKKQLNARKEAIKAPEKGVRVRDLNEEAVTQAKGQTWSKYDLERRGKKLGF